MIITVLIAIWAFGLLLLFTDPRRLSTRWASATAFIGGLGYFAAVIDEELYPLLQGYVQQYPLLNPGMLFVSSVSSFICQIGLPYTFLMFAVHSCDFMPNRVKMIIQYAALLPPLLMLVITPIYPVLQFDYWIMVMWVTPYFLCTCVLLIYLYWTERDPMVKKSRFINNVLAILPLLFVFISIYVMRIFDQYDAWRYNIVIVSLQFILFLAISVKYGLLGVKLRIEKRRLDSTLRAMTSGASILNHTIKNELGKINLYADRIQSYASDEKRNEMNEDMTVLLQSTQNIMNMVNRIQGQIQDIVLKEDIVPLHEVVTRVLQDVRPYVEKKQIEVRPHLDEKAWIKGDPVHLREVIANLCQNAIEAMHQGGVLTVSLYRSKKHLVVSVADTGVGISKENLGNVLDPFFTTKKNGQNYGLGLSYCYNVMQKHQGMLEIQSVKEQGTTVYLYFPSKLVVEKSPREE
ncbi:HAMP domain-containing histidine kinase [Brevibacillus humidisoli]|uniref:sensor histidine kinase n=1 Tax=Brevibacillus humidisoli TaxID=2895522 RepID=UPI001E5BF87B|nr:HAMP domain-containing sensor histidine kinase [Brevibacillus humidisoli]UFJ39317.1 HAMP domain-containing histidine kinase [Brevibacillus humidisoli]